MKRFILTIHKQQENGNIDKIVHHIILSHNPSIGEIEGLYDLNRPDVNYYSIEEEPFCIEDDIIKWVESHIEDTNQNFDIINLIIRTARHYYSLGIKNAQKDPNFKE